MTKATIDRELVELRLQIVQEALFDSIAGLYEARLQAIRVTPDRSAIDLLRHIWVRNELCARCLADWDGRREWTQRFASEDSLNIEMVAARSSRNLLTILEGINSVYQRYAAMLHRYSDAVLGESGTTPWGQELTRLELIYSELGHNHELVAQIKAACMQPNLLQRFSK